jgi:hypothetical protein
MMQGRVRTLFERYERFFNRSLGGDMDVDELASLYGEEKGTVTVTVPFS